MRLLSETEILICLPIKGSRCDVKSLKEREAGFSGAPASASPGPHLPLFRCSQLPAYWLLGNAWKYLQWSPVFQVAFASIAGLLLNPKDPELQESSPL